MHLNFETLPTAFLVFNVCKQGLNPQVYFADDGVKSLGSSVMFHKGSYIHVYFFKYVHFSRKL